MPVVRDRCRYRINFWDWRYFVWGSSSASRAASCPWARSCKWSHTLGGAVFGGRGNRRAYDFFWRWGRRSWSKLLLFRSIFLCVRSQLSKHCTLWGRTILSPCMEFELSIKQCDHCSTILQNSCSSWGYFRDTWTPEKEPDRTRSTWFCFSLESVVVNSGKLRVNPWIFSWKGVRSFSNVSVSGWGREEWKHIRGLHLVSFI
jgi:hypothetical protein